VALDFFLYAALKELMALRIEQENQELKRRLGGKGDPPPFVKPALVQGRSPGASRDIPRPVGLCPPRWMRRESWPWITAPAAAENFLGP